MEAKKNPAHDVHRFSGIIFFFSLSLSLGLLIVAFEWRTVVDNDGVTDSLRSRRDIIDDQLLSEVKATPEKRSETTLTKKQPQKIVNPERLVAVANDAPALKETNVTLDMADLVEQGPLITTVEIPKEEADSVFTVAEKMPLPIGGMKGFENSIRENLRYPRGAKRQGIEGKVDVEFIVNEQGDPVNFRIRSGIGAGCDEEAIRVLSLIKWTPGKQRGRPVKVKMVLPLTFRLN